MKKTLNNLFFILIFATLAATASAQSLTHPADTIHGREITYYYMDWIDSTENCSPVIGVSGEIPYEVAKYCYTDSVLPVIGVAASILTRLETGVSASQVSDTSLQDWTDYLRLYKPLPDNAMTLLAQSEYTILDTTRMISVAGLNLTSMETQMSDETHWLFPIYEAYFDKPYYVTDSFYVSAACMNNQMDRESQLYAKCPTSITTWQNTDFCNHAVQRFAYRSFFSGAWQKYEYGTIYWLWPIIDTTGMNYIAPCDTFFCAGVSDLHVGHPNHVRGGIIDFVWTGAADHSRWQLSYGPAGTAPGEGSILNCSTPAVDVYGMQDSVHYVCYVRGYCDMCHKWGDWSEGFEYWKEMYTEPAEIRPGRLDRFVTVMPNPATQYVSIMSSFKISRIEAFDLQGALVDEQPVDAFGATLDLSRWPRGTYILNIRTNQGTMARKIVVE